MIRELCSAANVSWAEAMKMPFDVAVEILAAGAAGQSEDAQPRLVRSDGGIDPPGIGRLKAMFGGGR